MSKLILPENNAAIQQLVNEAFLGLGDTNRIQITDEILYPSDEFVDNPFLDILNIFRNPDNFYYTCKHILNLKLHPFQIVILQELWVRKFPMLIASRGSGKSFILSVYCILRALFHQPCKIILVGGAFRQSKILFDYMETIWSNSPVLRSIVGESQREGPRRDIDRCTFFIGRSEIMAIPLGSKGEKIRGLRSNYTITDEFSSVPNEIFETVVRGFGAVTSDPVENVKRLAGIDLLKDMGLYNADMENADAGMGNQTVLAGTAYYAFNHFYSYWKKYKGIIESGGEQRALEELFEGDIPPGFNWRDFSIIRLPYFKLPRGFLDDVQISQAKVLSHSSTYLMEYNTIFAVDSDGFFKRSIIEKCTCKNPIQLPSGPVQFEATTMGSPNSHYVMAIDPASEKDNFAIIILEVFPDHRRIVYSWTVTRQKLRERLKKCGVENTDQSFYNYCAQKIIKLAKLFPTEHIGIDAQGGGIGIIEALHDASNLEANELPILPYIKQGDNDVFWWEEKNKPTDGLAGRHILHVVQFANQQFVCEANHGLRQDLETRILLFPFFDAVSIGLAIEEDKILGREYDTLEDVVVEIEELKDELATIVHSQTANGRDRWDTPETKISGVTKKGQMRKDRYSALVIANMLARLMSINTISHNTYHAAGGYAGQTRAKPGATGQLYIGPQHIINKMSGGLGISH